MRGKKRKSLFLYFGILILFIHWIWPSSIEGKIKYFNWVNDQQFQTLQPSSPLIPIAVRVFAGSHFIENLSLDDFEIIIGDRLEKPVSLFLVNQNKIERQEGRISPKPDLTRRIIIMMKMIDYHPQLAQAIEDLFMNELLPGDTLEIQTPMKNYMMAPGALEKVPKPVLIKNALELVRKDILQGNMLYNSLLNELKRFVRRISGASTFEVEELGGVSPDLGLPFLFQNYRMNMQKLEALRRLDEDQLIQYAEAIKKRPGQKFIFFFYQREFLPEISPMKMNELATLYQDQPNIVGELQDLFQQFYRPLNFNIPALEEAFASSEAQLNFLFLNKDAPKVAGLVMRERSEDIYKLMSKLAKATGGIIEASQNPEAAFKKAFALASRYYLLYLEPQRDLLQEGFNQVIVKIKRENVALSSRLGFSLFP
ncbi:MAG: hypothetical protein N3B16_08635 [Candidatus Aminicenantes bacterium]|nr:hypothetical protein [Candidatus Aminicenantes bacterium]